MEGGAWQATVHGVAKIRTRLNDFTFTCDPMDCSCQAPLFMGFSRQEHWSGLPCPSPGDLPAPRIEHMSLMSPALAGRFFTTSTTWEAQSQSQSLRNPNCIYLNCIFKNSLERIQSKQIQFYESQGKKVYISTNISKQKREGKPYKSQQFLYVCLKSSENLVSSVTH